MIPDVGELMVACFLMDLNSVTILHDWWLGEKFDGVRVCWNPKKRKCYTRQGRILKPADEICKPLPLCFLDGEFWFGRKNMLLALQLASVHLEDEVVIKWEVFRYLAFDSPSPHMFSEYFEQRYANALQHTAVDHSLVRISVRFLCPSNRYMQTYLNNVIGQGGEGIVLRKWNSLYEHGKSPALLKLKNMIDVEGLVVDIKGSRYTCKLPNNDLITTTKRHKLFVKIGDVVSFVIVANKKIRDNTLHKIVRVRHDLLWQDVVNKL